MKNYKIAIVNSNSFGRIYPEDRAQLEQIGEVHYFFFSPDLDGKELAVRLNGYNIIIASITPLFSSDFFHYKDELLLISRHGIGHDNIDLKAAAEHMTIVTTVPALVEREAVAENTITNLLANMRMTILSSEKTKTGRWEERANFVGNSLFNKTVGIVGIGNIGSAVAEICRNGFRCKLIAYDPFKSQLYMNQYGVTKVDFKTLLEESDVICLCANLTKDNYHMINTNEVAHMKHGVYISNTARGALVDENAIISGIKSKIIAGYSTDVMESEPVQLNHPYLAYDNILVTPHTSSYTKGTLYKMGKKCVQDVKDVVAGNLSLKQQENERNCI